MYEFNFLLTCEHGYEEAEWHIFNLLLIGEYCGFTIETIPPTVNKRL